LIWDGTGPIQRVQGPRSKVQGPRSKVEKLEPRNSDFGLWTAGLWTNVGTGHVVLSSLSRGILTLTPARLSLAWAHPRRTGEGEIGFGLGSRDPGPALRSDPGYSCRAPLGLDKNGTGHVRSSPTSNPSSKIWGSQFRLWTLDCGTLDQRRDGTRCFTERIPANLILAPLGQHS
jgi:hypothetical protein